MLRAAIVGLGSWARTLVRSVHGHSDELRFVAACTRTPASAEAYCREHGLRLTSDYAGLLADPSIDAVVLATPNSLHETQIVQAASAGRHVYVEKPFALTAASARTAIIAVERAGVTLAVGLNRRFHPSMIELTRRVTSGELGMIGAIIAELTATTGFYRANDSWRVHAEEEPAGAMASIGVHLVDAMLRMAGRVREVYCIAAQRGGPHGDDTTSLLLQFESGVSGLIYCSVAAARNHRIAVYGTKGFAEVLKPTMDVFRFVPAAEGRRSHLATIPEPQIIKTPGFNYVGESLIAFAHCIREHKPYPISTADVLHGVAVFEAAVRSATEKRSVQVTD